MDAVAIRERLTEAIRYWEPRRLAYNVVLLFIVGIYFYRGLPHSREMAGVNGIMVLFLLAVLANVAYCAAYVVDIFAQLSGLREEWRRYRWIVFTIGLAFAGVLTRFWSMGQFGIE